MVKSRAQSKPRILLIADVPNWIFARHCQMLRRFLSDQFDFTVQFQGHPVAEECFDLIYPLEWDLVPRQQIRTSAKYVTGVRSHISWKNEDFLPFADFLVTYFQRVHVVSRRLHCLFEPFVPRLALVSHGVDTGFFKAQTRADQSGRGAIRIGWAGNRVSPTKGFDQYIAPLATLPGVELCFCGFQDHNRNIDEMRAFYDTLDVYLCASSVHHEGNNNSLMEAAAMERALVTNDSGTVPEYLRHGESALIVERDLPAFIQAVERLRDDPELRSRLGSAARASVKRHFDWEARAEDYRAFFLEALSGRSRFHPCEKAEPRAPMRTSDEKVDTCRAAVSSHEETASKESPRDEQTRRSPRQIGLFGASSRGRQYLTLLAANDRFLPVCFFDNDPDKWGAQLENLPVYPPEKTHLDSVDVVLIASVQANEILGQLASLGISRRVALDLPDLFLRFSNSDGCKPPDVQPLPSG